MDGKLNWSELETVVGWFLYRMAQDQRGRLMAELPQLYGKMFPGVSSEAITDRVRAALDAR
jgi:hypothetical protein